jgi:hypothetical protein
MSGEALSQTARQLEARLGVRLLTRMAASMHTAITTFATCSPARAPSSKPWVMMLVRPQSNEDVDLAVWILPRQLRRGTPGCHENAVLVFASIYVLFL